MTSHQRNQISVATLVTVATLIGGVVGSITAAYKLGDDRYVRTAEITALKKDFEYLKAAVDRIERRQLGNETTQGSAPLASRNSHGQD